LSTRPPQKKRRSRAGIIWKRWGDWRKIAIALVTGLFISALLTIQLLPDKVSLRVNDVAVEDVIAPRYVRYEDQNKTAFMRKLAASQVPRVYLTILGANGDARQNATRFFDMVDRLRANPSRLPDEKRVAYLRKQVTSLTEEQARSLLHVPADELNRARAAADSLVEEAQAQAISTETIEQAKLTVRNHALDQSQLPPPVRRVVGQIAASSLLPNQYYNAAETKDAQEREKARVPAQYETIRRGDLILRKGEKVTLEHLTKLTALGLIRERIDFITAISLVLLSFGLVALFCLYLNQFHPKVLRSLPNLVLISVVVTGCLLLFRITSTALGLRFSGDQLGYLGMSTSALGAMLIAALLCPQVAVFTGVSLGILTSVLVGAELKFAILSIVSSLVAVQCVTQIRNRADILRAGVIVSVVNVITAMVAQGATQSNLPEELLQNAMWASFGGFGSVLLFGFFAAWLERPFRLTTPLTLLELSDPSHPLLRRLQMEAPGTYHHSIIVGNLAEAAAEAIGADGLFCRVASYYHDVGKIIRPHFFVENQLSENRHNTINPSLSSLVVTSHVRDGVELAEEHRLPPPLINIIREHHGTCLIKYFYHQAVTSSGEESTHALEYQFRYEGPRPQTKESGVIMIADSVEAASRALDKATPGRIRDLIDRIVRDRLADGQLDECELTFKDLEKITSSMTRSLTSLLHARVEYPAGDTSDLRRLAADGGAGKEPVGVRKALSDTPETAAAPFVRPPRL
jgi:cyclic-di-AMP phosphodiesterase PgpH